MGITVNRGYSTVTVILTLMVVVCVVWGWSVMSYAWNALSALSQHMISKHVCVYVCVYMCVCVCVRVRVCVCVYVCVCA